MGDGHSGASAVAEPCEEAREEFCFFVEAIYVADEVLVESDKAACAVADVNVGDAVEQVGYEPGAQSPPKWILAFCADAVDYIKPFAEFVYEQGYLFRRGLHVGVDEDDGVAPGSAQSRSDGHLLSEISYEPYDFDGFIFVEYAFECDIGPILAAVVDKDYFV